MQTDQAIAPQFKRDLNTDIYPYTLCSEFTASYARALAAELIAAADAATGRPA